MHARALSLMMLLAAGGCSAVLSFHECNVDDDCKGVNADGGMLYCSDDHMCVGATPDYLLCKVSVPQTTDNKVPDGALVVGGLFRTSGPNDVNDHAFQEAADLAAQEFRDANYNIAHVVCDTAGDPAQAARAYQVVIDRFGAKIIVGPDRSVEVLGMADLVKSRGVPIISPSATNPKITDLADDDRIWRTAASDNLQAKVLATLPLSTSKLDILYESDNTYAVGLKDAFVGAFSTIGGSVNATLGFDSTNQADIDAKVATASSDQPSYALLIADFAAPPLVASVAKAPGLAMTQFLMTDSAKKPSLWGQLGGNYAVMSRVRGTGPANPDPKDPSGMAFAVMASNFKSKFGEDPTETSFVNNSYDAFYVAAYAALSLSPDQRSTANIVANLGRLSDVNAQKVFVGPNGTTGGVTGLQQGSIDVVGTSGPLDFDEHGDVASAPIEKWSVDTTGASPTFKTDTIVTP